MLGRAKAKRCEAAYSIAKEQCSYVLLSKGSVGYGKALLRWVLQRQSKKSKIIKGE